MSECKILHLDLDAFYPSVEVLDDPRLAGKPVIVGGLGNRGVVASASYEARTLGVHSALPMAIARRRCPDGVYLRPRFDRYRALSRQIFAIYRDWTPLVEPLSLDEAYLDVSSRRESARDIATRIKAAVREATGLTVSAGVSGNKFLAKLASDMDKPDGLTVLDPDVAPEILAPMPVGKLWGVGPATERKLVEAGFLTIGDVAAVEPSRLELLVGSQATRLQQLARAQDARRVAPPGRPKSLSCETTFETDLGSWKAAAPHVRRFADRLSASLERHDLWARTVVLKVRFPDFTTVTRSTTEVEPVRDAAQIRACARTLARRVSLADGGGIRLIGLGLQNLVADPGPGEKATAAPGGQLELFGEPDG